MCSQTIYFVKQMRRVCKMCGVNYHSVTVVKNKEMMKDLLPFELTYTIEQVLLWPRLTRSQSNMITYYVCMYINYFVASINSF